MTLGVSVPAYANIDALRRCLKSVAQVAREVADHIVVVDDSGGGRIASILRAEFPHVKWIVHAANLGFGASANEAVMASQADIVILLNDDTELLSLPTQALFDAFTDEKLFAVTFRSLDETGTIREGAKRLQWRFGYPRVLHNERDQIPALGGIQSSSYAVGGHAAFRRTMFAELHGFDPLYEPFYWEDVDLSMRAANRGWGCIFLPECTVRHAGDSAIRSLHDQDHIRMITQRNRLLFAWRHGTRLQNALLRMSIGGQQLWKMITRDKTYSRALNAARKRWLEAHPSRSSLQSAPNRGVPVEH